VTAKTFVECLYLVPGLMPIYALCNHALGSHSNLSLHDYFSIFCALGPCIFLSVRFTEQSGRVLITSCSTWKIGRSNHKRPQGSRVPGLPVRNCARVSNNLVPRGTKVNAIDVTTKTFFERLYLFPELSPSKAPSQLSVCPHTPTVHTTTISRFPCNFLPQTARQFCCQHDSPSSKVI
jgi:hypothetical protein